MCDENGPCEKVSGYRERIREVHRAVAMAASGNLEGGGHALAEALGDSSAQGLICLFGLGSIAETYYRQTIGKLPEGAFYGFESVVDTTTGKAMDDPPEDFLFAGRFGIAYANRDPDACIALFNAAVEGGAEHIATCITTMFKMTAGQLRALWDMGVKIA